MPEPDLQGTTPSIVPGTVAETSEKGTDIGMFRKLIAVFLAVAALAAGLTIVVNQQGGYQASTGGWEEARRLLATPPVRSVNPPDSTAQDVSQWKERIQTCIPVNETQDAYSDKAVERCLLEVFTTAAVKLETQALATALSELIVVHPLLGLPCHAPAHIIGETVLKAAGGDIVQALATHDHPSCEAGFIHGMIDAFAAKDPSPAEFARLVAACEASADTNMLHYCTHGIGHAAWIVTNDGPESSRYCALLRTPEGRAQCGEGVMMDMYEPATNQFPTRDSMKAPEEMPMVCANWAEPELPGMLEGCAHGAAFVFSKRALERIYVWAHKIPYPYPDELPEQFNSEVTEIAETVASWCGRLPGRAADSCLRDLGIAYPHVPHPLLLRPDVRTLLCRPLGVETLRNCVAQVRNNI